MAALDVQRPGDPDRHFHGTDQCLDVADQFARVETDLRHLVHGRTGFLAHERQPRLTGLFGIEAACGYLRQADVVIADIAGQGRGAAQQIADFPQVLDAVFAIQRAKVDFGGAPRLLTHRLDGKAGEGEIPIQHPDMNLGNGFPDFRRHQRLVDGHAQVLAGDIYRIGNVFPIFPAETAQPGVFFTEQVVGGKRVGANV